MGIYVFDTAFLVDLLRRDADTPGSSHDFGHDLLPRLAAAGQLHAHRFEHSAVGATPYWRDVGTVDAYFDAHMDLLGPQPPLDLHDADWPVLSLQRQLPPARFMRDAAGRCGSAVDSWVASGCTVQGARVAHSVLFSKVAVGPGSEVQHSLLLPGVTLGRGVRLQRVIVDKRCVLPDGLQVGFDPAADAARFFVSEGGVVVVTPEMLQTLAASPHAACTAAPLHAAGTAAPPHAAGTAAPLRAASPAAHSQVAFPAAPQAVAAASACQAG
jgi:glucose-1-phosphate adenylyltransferase